MKTFLDARVEAYALATKYNLDNVDIVIRQGRVGFIVAVSGKSEIKPLDLFVREDGTITFVLQVISIGRTKC